MNTPEHEPNFRCATFSPVMQAAIPPDIRAKMDADRARAEAVRDRTVWLLEAPAIPGYYLRATPRITGKLGTQTEVGTTDPWEALHFRRRRMAEEYMRQNPHPAWTPTEHIFDSPNTADEGRAKRVPSGRLLGPSSE